MSPIQLLFNVNLTNRRSIAVLHRKFHLNHYFVFVRRLNNIPLYELSNLITTIYNSRFDENSIINMRLYVVTKYVTEMADDTTKKLVNIQMFLPDLQRNFPYVTFSNKILHFNS